jgi:hypothetical protein
VVHDDNPTARVDTISFAREMGISHAEFFRTLPAAIGHRPYTVSDNTVVITDATRQAQIQLSAEGERKLGSLRLPSTTVSFSFSGYTRSEVERFMVQFDLCFQRGGG